MCSVMNSIVEEAEGGTLRVGVGGCGVPDATLNVSVPEVEGDTVLAVDVSVTIYLHL